MRKTCLNTVYELAKKDKKILFIGSDLGPGVLDDFKKNIPKRFFMEGVSEQSIIGLSAGLAIEGFKPYVNTIATFITRRCFEQLAIDLCLHNLPVKLIGNGGGLVYTGCSQQLAGLFVNTICTGGDDGFKDWDIDHFDTTHPIMDGIDRIQFNQVLHWQVNDPDVVAVVRGHDWSPTEMNSFVKSYGKGKVAVIGHDYNNWSYQPSSARMLYNTVNWGTSDLNWLSIADNNNLNVLSAGEDTTITVSFDARGLLNNNEYFAQILI